MKEKNQAGLSDMVAFVACAGCAAGKARFQDKCSSCREAVEAAGGVLDSVDVGILVVVRRLAILVETELLERNRGLHVDRGTFCAR